MLINGEKYACEACVRGHRVSSCTHSERKLLHVNKKGRPVSQCPHCRSLRKARSQHVKCECHDKSHAKEDCPHLKNLPEGQLGATPSSCCCGHGEKCSCSLKKDHFLENIPEDITSHPPKPLHKFTGPTVNSHDTKPTVFTNGHHKPVHKFNDAHNHCGAPYRVPSRSGSQHGHREIAQRSTDSLPLTNKTHLHHESPLHNVTNASQQIRQVRSEHNSPILEPIIPSGPPFNVEIPPLSPNAYSYSPFDAQSPSIQPGQRLPETIPDHWFTTHDEAHSYGPPNVPDLSFIDWSNYGFGNLTDTTGGNGGPYNPLNVSGLSGAQIPAYAASIDHLGLMGSGYNTSSADISDAEDHPANFRPTNLRTISHTSNDVSSNGDQDGDSHRLSTASSYFGTPQGNMLAANLEDLDIDKYIAEQKQLNMMQKQSAAPEVQKTIQQQPTPPLSQYTVSTPPDSTRGFSVTSNPSVGGEHSYTVHEAQAYAHMSEAADNFTTPDQKQAALMQSAGMMDDPMWCGPADQQPEFRLDDQEEDEQWAR